METLKVVSPLGSESVERQNVAPPLHDLNGKTVCEAWTGAFKGDYTFPVLRGLLKKRYPGVNIVPYTEFPHFYGGDAPAYQKELARQIAAMAKEKRCDVLISGNGA